MNLPALQCALIVICLIQLDRGVLRENGVMVSLVLKLRMDHAFTIILEFVNRVVLVKHGATLAMDLVKTMSVQQDMDAVL